MARDTQKMRGGLECGWATWRRMGRGKARYYRRSERGRLTDEERGALLFVCVPGMLSGRGQGRDRVEQGRDTANKGRLVKE